MSLDEIVKKPESMFIKEWEVLDRMILGLIWLSLSSYAASILWMKRLMDLMTILTRIYKKSWASNKMFLIKSLFNIEIIDESPIVEHLNNFNIVTNQLFLVGIKFDGKIRTLLFLSSLADSWDGLVMMMSNSSSNLKLIMMMLLDWCWIRRSKKENMETSNVNLNVEDT